MLRTRGALLLFLLPALPATAELRFELVTEPWGIDFRHHHCGTGKLYMIETMGSGVAAFDYDGDGDPDLLFVDSGLLPGYDGEPPKTRLFRNDGGGSFADVTERSGIVVTAYGMGATAGDADGDGDLDVYVTSYGPNQLFLNNGDGTFTDATGPAGVGDPLWGTSTAFADSDNDGDLDLYVTNYVDFTLDNNPPCGPVEFRSYCHPEVYDGVPDRFYQNHGDATFEDVVEEAFGDTTGKGLGVAWSDFDGDGRVDLYVANDMTFNFHFQNRGGGKFEEMALLSGSAVGHLGQLEASMGVALGDPDNDGSMDLFVTHLANQTNAFYTNTGAEMFTDRRFEAGLAEPSIYSVGFGTVFADFDSDGDEDLVVANGHVVHNVEMTSSTSTYRQRNQLFENLGNGTFREEGEAGLDVVLASRGLATADLDLDGDLDVVITNSNDVAEVYRNESPNGGWLRLDLVAPGGNRHGVGARIELRTGGKTQVREVRTGSSYLSQSEGTVHFGLGSATHGELVVRWPDRQTQKVRNVPAGRRLRLAGPRSGSAREGGTAG